MYQLDEKAIAALLDAVQPGVVTPSMTPRPDGRGALVALRQGYHIEEIDGRMKNSRRHVFDDLKSFAEWLNRHAGQNAERVEILAEPDEVSAALDPADPRTDLVTCNLTKDPMFAAWEKQLGNKMSQRRFHEFLRGHLDAFPDDQGIRYGSVLLSEVAKLSVMAGKEMQTEMDERGFVRFNGSTGRANVGGAIPPYFTIVTPIFLGVREVKEVGLGDEISYDLDIIVTLELLDGDPIFTLSCPSLPLVMHQARVDAVAYLQKLLIPGFLVGLGSLTLQPVSDVEPRQGGNHAA